MSVIHKQEEIEKTISKISTYIVNEHLKGKIPLFVIGSGISTDLEKPEHLEGKVKEMSVPNMFGMLEKLQFFYNEIKNDGIPETDKEDLDKRFKILHNQKQKKMIVDRTNVGEIFRYFQEKRYLKEAWIEFNEWLLTKCVDEKYEIGIMNAGPSKAHHKIAELYEKVNAFCLTTNFDGLMFRALEKKYEGNDTEKHSYWASDKLKEFFTEEFREKKSYVEVQIRGDIFFVNCDPKWCDQYYRCENCVEDPLRIWESGKSLKCVKEEHMKPFISFPGTYAKDKEVREILNVLWQYLTSKVSCVITIGISGLWDPILVAFLADLVRERDIPLINVTTSPDSSNIHKEIVKISERVVSENETPIRKLRSTIELEANEFMEIFNPCINQAIETPENSQQTEILYRKLSEGDDEFWSEILDDKLMSDFEEELIGKDTVKITSEFAQLGLKSQWYGVNDRWMHNRLNHAKGVMKIATCLYENACKNSKRPVRDEEKQFLRIAALLHDIGHLPFSHLIEEVFQELNWKPSGYVESFSHDYYTEEKIKEIFEDTNSKKKLKDIGYTVDDLIRLINGDFGIGFLDAIINSPFDADKIDYVFRDADVTNVFIPQIKPKQFIDRIKLWGQNKVGFLGY